MLGRSALVAGLAGALVASQAAGGVRPAARIPLGGRLPSDTAWLAASVENATRLRLLPGQAQPWLERYLRPWENHTPDWRAFLGGRYGPHARPQSLAWDGGDASEAHAFGADAESDFGASLGALPRLRAPLLEALSGGSLPALVLDLRAPRPLLVPVAASRPCPRWRAPRPVTVVRYAGERERLALFDCEGAIAPDVIDRLSRLARSPDSARPALPLPDAPSAGVLPGEWVSGLHLLDPRLVWALGKIAQAFPDRPVVLMSGYRPDAHTSLHRRGRALDLYVTGVPNEAVLRICRQLPDVGCGYYPNGSFVHVDVRPWGTGRVLWVDASRPGEPSRYADGWPGVVAPGAAWLGG